MQPNVSILIPARNERFEIRRALDAVLAQDYPHSSMEIILVDGGSTDNTGEYAAEVLRNGDFARVVILDNPTGTTPSNLNVGLAASDTRLICRVDARSVIPQDYVRRCVALLDKNPDYIVVGGAQVALSRGATALPLGIARALNNRFGMGFARYRRDAKSGPADTVYLGAFRTEQLRQVGGWDERFATNQDFELNRRLSRYGKIWFEAGMDVGYIPRSNIGDLFRQYRRFGQWKVTYWRLTGDRPQTRQILLLVAPVVGLGSIVAVIVISPRLLPPLLACFLASLAGVEAAGTRHPKGNLATHFIAMGAMSAVGLGWTFGVWHALLVRKLK